VCNVTPPVVWRWLFLGLIPGPPWTLQQLHNVRDMTDPQGRRRGPQVAHGTLTRWNEGCSFTRCRQAQNNAASARGRARAQTVDDRGCAEVPQQTPSATGPAAAVHLCRRASHASRRTRSRAGEQPEAVAQPRCDLLRGERAHPGGGQANASGMPSSARQIRSTGPPSPHPPPNTPPQHPRSEAKYLGWSR
jgi:hypothetical protein